MGASRHVFDRERRRAFLIVSALDVVFAFVDLWRGLPVEVLWAHLALIAVVVAGAGAYQVSRDPARVTFLTVSIGLLPFTALAMLGGGTTGSYFRYFPAIPFVCLLFVVAEPWHTFATGLLATACAAGVLLRERPLDADASLWLLQMASSTTLAVYGSVTFKKAKDAERAARLAEEEGRKRLDAAGRLATVGTLAAGIGHEINNPLAYVKANVAWLLDEGAKAPDVEKRVVLGETLQGIERIEATVADLRLLVRPRDDSLEPVPVGDAIDEALRLARTRINGIRIDRQVADGLPPARTSRRRLVQVLVNLVANAADAVGGRPPTEQGIRVWARRDESTLVLGVDDTGPGLTAEVREHLFEPLFTTKDPSRGTGLGLMLCREYVEKAGGTIAAEDAPGGGARFVVRLPLSFTPPPPVRQPTG